eukprot:CAMPEP_0168459950 /NCGR_PEP_ID=MMETSP0228-20121227/53188_1 /TAXON_ID=133427 /ORGANISM="Protoceratium reticulatum, Strain CCCM 535 (=CCMP 1889)" /LENGTH=239 /DNA_ID=CAMNT_0008475159 /DNA_START=59 /DNA_END=775 /DNA_ORIENTATION=+
MMGVILGQVIDVLVAARTELLLFVLAIAVHHFLFGKALPSPAKGRPERQGRGREAPADCEEECARAGASGEDAGRALRSCAGAHGRGDHRAVVRHWDLLKKSDQVPATRLAQVVESMQRTKKDSATIIAEVRGYLRRNRGLCGARYANRLLEPLAKSLDTDVVLGIVDFLPSLDVEADSTTYEILIQMHFSTRSFKEVLALASEMRLRGIEPSRGTSLVLLKTALQRGELGEALRLYRE